MSYGFNKIYVLLNIYKSTSGLFSLAKIISRDKNGAKAFKEIAPPKWKFPAGDAEGDQARDRLGLEPAFDTCSEAPHAQEWHHEFDIPTSTSNIPLS